MQSPMDWNGIWCIAMLAGHGPIYMEIAAYLGAICSRKSRSSWGISGKLVAYRSRQVAQAHINVGVEMYMNATKWHQECSDRMTQ